MNKVRETVVSIGAPVDKNVIWIDTSSVEPIQKVFLNGEWKPLKDADVDAKFHDGQKVSDITLVEASGTSTDNSKIATVAKLNETIGSALTSYHDRAPYENVTVSGNVGEKTATINYNNSTNKNWVVNLSGTSGNDPDIVVLTKVAGTNDSVTTIRFKSTSTPTTLDYVDTVLLWANEELPICEENTEYLIAIWNNIGVMTKLNTIENSNS